MRRAGELSDTKFPVEEWRIFHPFHSKYFYCAKISFACVYICPFAQSAARVQAVSQQHIPDVFFFILRYFIVSSYHIPIKFWLSTQNESDAWCCNSVTWRNQVSSTNRMVPVGLCLFVCLFVLLICLLVLHYRGENTAAPSYWTEKPRTTQYMIAFVVTGALQRVAVLTFQVCLCCTFAAHSLCRHWSGRDLCLHYCSAGRRNGNIPKCTG